MDHESEDYLHALRRSSRRRTVFSGAILAGVACSAFIAILVGVNIDAIEAYQRGERDLLGNRHFEPQHAPSLDGIDLQTVHTKLLPAWAIALAHLDERWTQEDRAFKALRSAVAADANLLALVDEFREIGWHPDAANHADRLEYLAWAWSDYLERRGKPYALEANVMNLASGEFLYFKAYRIAGRPRAHVGDSAYELQLVRRLDRTNIRELYLGVTHVEGVHSRLVADRIDDFAGQKLVPLLGVNKTLTPLEAAVKDELRGTLSKSDYRLIQTAVRRDSTAQEVEFEIRREPDCADYSLKDDTLSHFGFLGSVMFNVRNEGPSEPCTLNRFQFRALEKAQYWNRNEVAQTAARYHLMEIVAEAVALHEVRHMADAERGLDYADSGGNSEGALVEVSAYVASFAWSETPALALYQACQVKDTRGAHGEAVRHLIEELGASCNAMPDDFQDRAKDYAQTYFGHDEPITVVLD